MRLIAVVADTHVPTRVPEVPVELLQDLERHEPYKIFHAGDLTAPEVIDVFEFIAPTHAVKGNNDQGLDIPHEYAETFEGVTVAMRHRPRLDDIDHFAVRHEADIVVYGHTHAPTIEDRDGVTTVNPGSPTVPRNGAPTYAFISIAGERFYIELQQLPGND